MSNGRGAGRRNSRGLLAVAIEREQWEVAALCLLLGVSRAARSLPPDAVEALIEVLGEPRRTRRPGKRRGSCHERGG